MVGLVSPRLQFTRDGRHVVWCEPDRIVRADSDGRQHSLAIADTSSIATFADQLWTATDRGFARWTFEGRALGEPIECAERGTLVSALVGTACAGWSSAPNRLWIDDLGTFRELLSDDERFPFAGRRVVTISRSSNRVIARLGTASWSLPSGAEVIAAAALFDGAGLLLVIARGAIRELWVATAAGALQHRIEIPSGEVRIAARRGLAIVHEPGAELVVLDLRFGRQLGACCPLGPGADIAIDPGGATLAMRDSSGVAIVSLAEALSTPRMKLVAEPVALPADAPAVIEDIAPQVLTPSAERELVRPFALGALSPRRAPTLRSRDEVLAALER